MPPLCHNYHNCVHTSAFFGSLVNNPIRHLQRTDLNGHHASIRIRAAKKGIATQRPNRQAEEDRSISDLDVGENWVSTDRRAVCAHVHACLFVSSPGPPSSHLASTALASTNASLAGIDIVSSRLRQPSMRDASMTALDGQRPAVLFYISQVVARHCHRPSHHSHHDRMLAFQYKHDHEAMGSASKAHRRMPPLPHPRRASMRATSSPRAPPRRSTSRPPSESATRPRLCPCSLGVQAIRARPAGAVAGCEPVGAVAPEQSRPRDTPAASPPAYASAVGSRLRHHVPNWETFAAWEWRPDLRIGYLGDADWDQKWAPIAFSEWIDISLTVIYVNQNIFLLFYSTFENC
jgi:hypothetical protein